MFNPGMKIYKTNLPYTLSEDLEILRYIKANHLHYDIKGEKIWREMEKLEEFSRSASSLRNHFDVIMRNVHSLKYRSVLTQKDICDLLDSWSETPSELKAALYKQRSSTYNRSSILKNFANETCLLEMNPKSLKSFINYQRYKEFKSKKQPNPETNRNRKELEKLSTIIENNETPSDNNLSPTEKLIKKYAHITPKSRLEDQTKKRVDEYLNKCQDYLENHKRKSETSSSSNRTPVINDNVPVVDLTLDDEYSHATAATCTVHSHSNRSNDFENVSSNYVNNFLEPEVVITESFNNIQQSIHSNSATIYSNSIKSKVSIKSETRKSQSIRMDYTKNVSLLLENRSEMKKLSYQESFQTTSNRSSFVNMSLETPKLSSNKSVENKENITSVNIPIKILQNRLLTHQQKCSIFCQSSEEYFVMENLRHMESKIKENPKAIEKNNETHIINNIENLSLNNSSNNHLIESNLENNQITKENPDERRVIENKTENEAQIVSNGKLNGTQKESSLPLDYYEKYGLPKPPEKLNILASETRKFAVEKIPQHNDNVDNDLRANLSNDVSQQILSLKKALNKFPSRKITPFYNRHDKNVSQKRKKEHGDDIIQNSFSSENNLSQPITWEYEDECLSPKRICYNKVDEKIENSIDLCENKNDSGCLIGSSLKQKSSSNKTTKNSLISSDESSFSWDVDNGLIENQKKSTGKGSNTNIAGIERINESMGIADNKLLGKIDRADFGDFLLNLDCGHKSQISQYLKNDFN